MIGVPSLVMTIEAYSPVEPADSTVCTCQPPPTFLANFRSPPLPSKYATAGLPYGSIASEGDPPVSRPPSIVCTIDQFPCVSRTLYLRFPSLRSL